MNTIGVYTMTTTPAGYKADLVKAFAKGVGKIANDKWRADIVPDDKVKNNTTNEKSIESLIKNNTKEKISVKNSTDLESSVIEKIKNN